MFNILDYKYFYLIGNMLLLVVWLLLYFFRKDLRREQMFLSFIGGLVAPILDYLIFYHDYWKPDYVLLKFNFNGVTLGLESILCGFLIAGISGTIYETVLRKRQLYSKPRTLKTLLLAIATLMLSIILTKLGLNSVWSSSITFMFASIYMIKVDNILLHDAIFSSLLFLIIIIGVYLLLFSFYPFALEKFWVIDNLTGISYKKIPIEELVWFVSAGSACGIFYEFWRNVRKYRSILDK